MANRNLVKHHGLVDDKRGAHAPAGGFLYAGIPMELARDGKLSYLARSVAMYVWSHTEKWQQSASAVAEALGMDRGSVAKGLAELQEHRWMVREVHQTVGPSGKPRTVREIWHLQMSNRRFSNERVRELSAPSDVRATPAPSDQTCGPHPHGGADDTSTGGVDDTRTIEIDDRDASAEMHRSNARTDQDETGLGSRSLAVEGSEAPRGADGRGSGSPSQEAASSAAEYRPDGLQPATATGSPFDGPFASEPARRAESAAREERAARYLEPATAATPWPPDDPWA